MIVGEGSGVGGMAVEVGVIVGSEVRVGSGGAAMVGKGAEAACVVASQAETISTAQHRAAICNSFSVWNRGFSRSIGLSQRPAKVSAPRSFAMPINTTRHFFTTYS
jgi:hypothetical protein